jgi:hypothetical protein
VALVAEDRQGDLRQRLALPIEADLAANLQGPAGVDVLLSRLVRLIGPDLIGTLAGLDGVLLGVRITLDRILTPRAALREGLLALSFSRSFDRQRVSAAVLESCLWTMGPMSAAAVGALRRSARS